MTAGSDRPELSVVLPAYDEGPNLVWLLPELLRVLDGIGATSEVLVVDAESPRDETPQVCRDNAVRYVARTGGPLYGHAIRSGLAAARGKRVVFMDADGSHGPEFIARLWEKRDDADLVIASRYVRGGRTENPAILIFMSLAVNVAFRVTLGLPCADVSNSFRLYNGDHVRALRLECDNFDIVEEILVKLAVLHPGYRVLEIPSTFERRKAGKTKRDLAAFAVGYVWTIRRLRRLKREAARTA